MWKLFFKNELGKQTTNQWNHMFQAAAHINAVVRGRQLTTIVQVYWPNSHQKTSGAMSGSIEGGMTKQVA